MEVLGVLETELLLAVEELLEATVLSGPGKIGSRVGSGTGTSSSGAAVATARNAQKTEAASMAREH